MKKFSESTGHKDLEGNWVNETPQAKLRNFLLTIFSVSQELIERFKVKIFIHDLFEE